MPPRRAAVLLVLLALTLPVALHAQRDSALSEGEVEKLRDAAYVPTDRVMVFIGFLDAPHQVTRKPLRPLPPPRP